MLSGSEFAIWWRVSVLSAAPLTALDGLTLRRWSAVAVAGGCLLAIAAALAVFVLYVVLTSA